MKIPVKREKLSDRLVVMIPPSMKEMLSDAERTHGLDIPEFTRMVLRSALEEIAKKT